MAEIRLLHLTKRFGDTVAFHEVDLEVPDAELMVLVGPCGCGKTTLLRVIAGLEEATEGEIWIGDRLANDLEPKDRDLAVIFQNYALYPQMTVEDNIAFGLRLRKTDPEEIHRRVHEATEMLGLQNLLDRRSAELSGGQQQRVALARAVVCEPAAFLMDEPLANLESKLRVQTRAELVKLHRRLGITTLYVTHDQVEALTMGDRIAVMHDGQIEQVDSPLGLYNCPASKFVASFIGRPTMNFVEGLILQENGEIYVDAGGFRLGTPPQKRELLLPYVGVPVVLGLRPGDMFDARLSTPVRPARDNTFTAQVEAVESQEVESLLRLRVGEDSLVMKTESVSPARPEEEIQVVVDLTRLHFFDPDSEIRII